MDYNKDIGIESLINSNPSEELYKVLNSFDKIQETICKLASDGEQGIQIKLKAGTVLVFAIMSKFAQGKIPKTFNKNDWKEIASAVYDTTLNLDEREYTKRVFMAYRTFIEASAHLITIPNVLIAVPAEKAEAIISLSEEIENKTEQLDKEEITETTYIEDCLWISLEAMIKLMSAYMSANVKKPEVEQLIEGISSFSFEYGRLMMFRKEQELLTQYIENQYIIDEQLEEKYNRFLEELCSQADAFTELINDAFEADFRNRLMSSAKLAEASGIEEGILYTIEDTDDFFLN